MLSAAFVISCFEFMIVSVVLFSIVWCPQVGCVVLFGVVKICIQGNN
jgi:hypothetical protein